MRCTKRLGRRHYDCMALGRSGRCRQAPTPNAVQGSDSGARKVSALSQFNAIKPHKKKVNKMSPVATHNTFFCAIVDSAIDVFSEGENHSPWDFKMAEKLIAAARSDCPDYQTDGYCPKLVNLGFEALPPSPLSTKAF